MSNPRLARQIGYNKKLDKSIVEEKSKKNPEPKKEKTKQAIGVKKWFTEHPHVNIKAICDDAGVDTSNFSKLLKSDKELPEKISAKIKPIIKLYGYAE